MIKVTFSVFNALNHAGLLQQWGEGKSVDGKITWPTYGIENDDETVTCRLISGQSIDRIADSRQHVVISANT